MRHLHVFTSCVSIVYLVFNHCAYNVHILHIMIVYHNNTTNNDNHNIEYRRILYIYIRQIPCKVYYDRCSKSYVI